MVCVCRHSITSSLLTLGQKVGLIDYTARMSRHDLTLRRTGDLSKAFSVFRGSSTIDNRVGLARISIVALGRAFG